MSDGPGALGAADEPADEPIDEPVDVGRMLAGIVLVAAMVFAWVVGTPPSAGPDEPTHLVRSAALVRGQLDGQPSETSSAERAFELPAWVGFPDPGCFAFAPYTPASCATSLPRPEGEVLLGTRAWSYQVWAYLLPGLGTLLPASIADWSARALGALLPVVVLGIALYLAARRGRLLFASLLVAATPLAWFTFAVVNPSGMVIAGGIGLCTGLAVLARGPTSLGRWLIAVSWAMMTLPRRDGLLWAILIVAVTTLLDRRPLLDLWRALRLGPQLVVGLSTAATLVWAAASDDRSERLLLATPLLLVAAELARRAWAAPWLAGTVRRVIAVVVAVVGVGIVAFLVIDQRTGGYDAEVMRIVVGRTGMHLGEAIGVLGWLDTPIPDTMVFVWLLTLGALVGGAVVADERSLLVAAAAIALTGVAASWVLEMAQGDPTGTYWQGRYYLPFLVGIPIVLGRTHLPAAVSARLGNVIIGLAIVVSNVAIAAAMRRWAVGIAGTMLPWRWDTYQSPLPPVVLLAVHLAASIGLWRWARALSPAPTPAPGPGAEGDRRVR